jgi:hypothetical protein
VYIQFPANYSMYLFSKFTLCVFFAACTEICRNDSRNSNVTAFSHKTRFWIDSRQEKGQSGSVVLQHAVARHLFSLPILPSHMQSCVTILIKFTLNFSHKSLVHCIFQPICASSAASELMLETAAHYT